MIKTNFYLNRIVTVIAFIITITTKIFSQGVSINTNGDLADTSAMLDVKSNSKGILMPRMSTSERNAIVTPAEALQIFNTTTKCFEFFAKGIWHNLYCATCPLPAFPMVLAI